MNRIQITDEWLYRYMPMAAEAFLEDIEKEIDYKYEFSIGFEKKDEAFAALGKAQEHTECCI